MNRFEIHPMPLNGVVRVDRLRLGDHRGFLSRLFCNDALADAGWHWPIAQINHTRTTSRGTVRGMHFQRPPHAEAKLVSCLRGEVWDVAVDVRTGSPTFLHWHGERLGADPGNALLLPPGFAHGFQALSDDVELLYCHSTAYVPSVEDGLSPLDPCLSIDWPLAVTGLSERDANHPLLGDGFEGVQV